MVKAQVRSQEMVITTDNENQQWDILNSYYCANAAVKFKSDQCNICLSDAVETNPNPKNCFLVCTSCRVGAHSNCLALLTTLTDTNNWQCAPCQLRLRPDRLRCELCPYTGGLYLRTRNAKFIHASCAVWFPYLRSSVYNDYDLTKTSKEFFQSNCLLCSKRGATIRCFKNHCKNHFHPACVMRHVDLKRSERSAMNGNAQCSVWLRSRKAKFRNKIFCGQHSSDAVSYADSVSTMLESFRVSMEPETMKMVNVLILDQFLRLAEQIGPSDKKEKEIEKEKNTDIEEEKEKEKEKENEMELVKEKDRDMEEEKENEQEKEKENEMEVEKEEMETNEEGTPSGHGDAHAERRPLHLADVPEEIDDALSKGQEEEAASTSIAGSSIEIVDPDGKVHEEDEEELECSSPLEMPATFPVTENAVEPVEAGPIDLLPQTVGGDSHKRIRTAQNDDSRAHKLPRVSKDQGVDLNAPPRSQDNESMDPIAYEPDEVLPSAPLEEILPAEHQQSSQSESSISIPFIPSQETALNPTGDVSSEFEQLYGSVREYLRDNNLWNKQAISSVFPSLGRIGWKVKWSVDARVSCIFAPWVPSNEVELWVRSGRVSLLSDGDLVEGRDVFYDNETGRRQLFSFLLSENIRIVFKGCSKRNDQAVGPTSPPSDVFGTSSESRYKSSRVAQLLFEKTHTSVREIIRNQNAQSDQPLLSSIWPILLRLAWKDEYSSVTNERYIFAPWVLASDINRLLDSGNISFLSRKGLKVGRDVFPNTESGQKQLWSFLSVSYNHFGTLEDPSMNAMEIPTSEPMNSGNDADGQLLQLEETVEEKKGEAMEEVEEKKGEAMEEVEEAREESALTSANSSESLIFTTQDPFMSMSMSMDSGTTSAPPPHLAQESDELLTPASEPLVLPNGNDLIDNSTSATPAKEGCVSLNESTDSHNRRGLSLRKKQMLVLNSLNFLVKKFQETLRTSANIRKALTAVISVLRSTKQSQFRTEAFFRSPIIPELAKWLQVDADPAHQYNSLCILGILTSGVRFDAASVMNLSTAAMATETAAATATAATGSSEREKNALADLVHIISSSKDCSCAQQAICVVSNILSNVVLNHHDGNAMNQLMDFPSLMDALLHRLKISTSSTDLTIAGVFLLFNICEFYPRHAKVHLILPIVVKILTQRKFSHEHSILKECCMILAALSAIREDESETPDTTEQDDKIALFLTFPALIPRMIELWDVSASRFPSHIAMNLRVAILRTLGNLTASDNHENTQKVLDSANNSVLLQILTEGVRSSKADICREACMVVHNLTGGTPTQCRLVLTSKAMVVALSAIMRMSGSTCDAECWRFATMSLLNAFYIAEAQEFATLFTHCPSLMKYIGKSVFAEPLRELQVTIDAVEALLEVSGSILSESASGITHWGAFLRALDEANVQEELLRMKYTILQAIAQDKKAGEVEEDLLMKMQEVVALVEQCMSSLDRCKSRES